MVEPADVSRPQQPGAARAGSGGAPAGGGGKLKVAAGIGVVLAVGAVLVGTQLRSSPTGSGSEVSIVSQADIGAASATLSAQAATGIVDEAKSCKTPMATITISKKPGAAPGVIRIRSGSYVSPAFTLGEAPQRVAIPFPTPYPTGIGSISVEGEASGAVVSLYPAVNIEALKGASPISIWWVPKKPC